MTSKADKERERTAKAERLAKQLRENLKRRREARVGTAPRPRAIKNSEGH